KGDLLLMRLVTYDAVANKKLPIYQSVKSNNFETIVHSFKIEALGKDLDSFIIDVRDFFTSDIKLIGGFTDYQKEKNGISTLEKSRSFIDWINVYPENVEVRHTLTYRASGLSDENISGFSS